MSDVVCDKRIKMRLNKTFFKSDEKIGEDKKRKKLA